VTVDNVNASRIIQSFNPNVGCAALFEYCITENGGAKRMGQIYAVWDGSSATHTDVSSPDLNGSTAGYIWKVQINSPTDLELACNVTTGTWNVLVSTRIIF
jgi:hypothetical protein